MTTQEFVDKFLGLPWVRAVTIVYDGDGKSVAETVGGVRTKYLVDTQNPTGYAQVVDELVGGGAVTRTYTYGQGGQL